jgi:hypothetical protein
VKIACCFSGAMLRTAAASRVYRRRCKENDKRGQVAGFMLENWDNIAAVIPRLVAHDRSSSRTVRWTVSAPSLSRSMEDMIFSDSGVPSSFRVSLPSK